jgi:signal transduction histidine kinase/ligand-binding sensor domain-containing protein
MRRFALLTICFFAFAATQAQEGLLQFEKINGLSQGTVYSILKDKQGFLWIATADGLNRYDGVAMKIYKPGPEKKSGQLEGRVIRSKLFEDDQEHIWFSNEIAGFDFDKKREWFGTHLFNINFNPPLGISVDPIAQLGDELWFANSSYGLIRYHRKTKEIKRFVLPKDSSNHPVYIFQSGVYDNKSHFYFASNNGLYSFDISNHQWQQLYKTKNSKTLCYSRDSVFINVGKEIYAYSIKHQSISRLNKQMLGLISENNFIHCLYEDPSGNIWAGDEQGNLFVKSIQENTFQYRGNINGNELQTTNYPVYSILVDTKGIIWVGADVLGLLKAPLHPFTFHSYPSKTASTKTNNFFVTSIYETSSNTVWVGTYKQGLQELNLNPSNNKPIHSSAMGLSVQANSTIGLIKEDEQHNLWVARAGGLSVKKRGTNIFQEIQIPLPVTTLQQSVNCFSIVSYKNGWLLGTNQGLYFIQEEQTGFKVAYFAEFGQTKISDIWVQSNNSVWLGYENGGIDVLTDLNNPKEHKKIFLGADVKSFYHDKARDQLWIASMSGLIVYDLASHQYQIFTEKEGLANSYVYGIIPTADQLWISTNSGLSKASLEYKQGVVLPRIQFTNFTKSDGLIDNEFNTGAFYKGSSGNLYFGTINGLVWFNPNEIVQNKELPHICMLTTMVNDAVADSMIAAEYIRNIDLPYNKNNLFFRFRGIEYFNPAQVTYQYKLEGWDPDWIQSGTLNEVRYNNLNPGNYTFRVKAANAAGIWNPEEYTIAIYIRAPFWKTTWFYASLIILLLVIIVSITRFLAQTKLKKQIAALERQKEIEKERQRISREMHDDIGAGLTQITLMSESVKSKSGTNAATELEEIANTSRQLVSNMSEIVWSLNPANKTLEQLMAYMREQLHKQLEYSNIEYTILLPEAAGDIVLSNEYRRNLLLVTKEIVNNAIKYSAAKNLQLHASIIDNYFICSIKDDGVGFDLNELMRGNGLKNIRYRIEELNGKLDIQTEIGKGAKFEYRIPLPTT